MSTGVGQRFHMGCGEPLQSRWWVTRTLRTQPAAEPEKRNGAVSGAVQTVAAEHARDGCKS